MCGIFCVASSAPFKIYSREIYLKNGIRRDIEENDISEVKKTVSLMDGRGETSNQITINNSVYMYHRRLPINDFSKGGNQPFISSNVFCIINGEIYNYKELKESLSDFNYKWRGSSDCEVLIPLYMKFGTQFVNQLRGMFSFVLYDSYKKLLISGRDHLGMTSLYMGTYAHGLMFSSELKCLTPYCENISNVEAGTIIIKSFKKDEDGHIPAHNTFKYVAGGNKSLWRTDNCNIKDLKPYSNIVLEELRNKMIASVKSHLNSDAKIGVLLSGGLDSSIVAAIVARLIETKEVSIDKLKTFTIGVENSTDILAADKVASHINSEHTAYNFDAEDAITVLEDVIYSIETYDITTIRASIPLYILSSWIKEDTDIKVILSGEVSDEIFAGYSYFKYAPNEEELFQETKDKVNMLQRYDCLRAHKSTVSNTIELRVPFGDYLIVDYVMNLHPSCKMYDFNKDKEIEKYILREAFKDWLPDEIVWRKKEQFSDGVSSEKENVIDTLKKHAEEVISDEEFNNRESLYPINTPSTKEGLLYYKIFISKFKGKGLESAIKTVDHNINSIACSTERALRWMNIPKGSDKIDPSGRIE